MAKTVSNVKINATFTTAASREQLTSGENLCTSLGKVNKYLVDLDSGAFSFPANGGDADTLDGFHETSFPRNREDISDCNNAVLPGTYNATPETINTPYSMYWFVTVEIAASGLWIRQTATISDRTKPNEIYCRLFINDKWSDSWVKVNDGGNADTLDGLHANEIASNPNLFINSDFRRPINQRGKTSYATEGYTIDRWSISTNLTLTVCDGYIKVCKSVLSGNPTFLQLIENMSEIAGKTVTFSMHYRSNVQLRVTGLDKNYYIPSTSGEWGDYKLTFTAPTGVNYLFSIQFTTAVTQADNYIDIMWTKAELGSVATLFCPPDPALELLKCQRYFVRLKNNHASEYAYNGTGYIMNATTAVITLSLPAVMRIPKPAVTASGENIPCIITPTTSVKAPITATYSNSSAVLANAISLVFAISNGTAGEPAMFLLKPGSDYIDISAEL